MKVISVKFRLCNSTDYCSQEYLYKTKYSLKKGDLVVVYHHGLFEVAMVYNEDVETSNTDDLDYVIQVIDVKEYSELRMKSLQLLDIKKAMDERVDSIQKSKIYEMLAKEDEVLADLLIEYKSKLAEM